MHAAWGGLIVQSHFTIREMAGGFLDVHGDHAEINLMLSCLSALWERILYLAAMETMVYTRSNGSVHHLRCLCGLFLALPLLAAVDFTL